MKSSITVTMSIKDYNALRGRAGAATTLLGLNRQLNAQIENQRGIIERQRSVVADLYAVEQKLRARNHDLHSQVQALREKVAAYQRDIDAARLGYYNHDPVANDATPATPGAMRQETIARAVKEDAAIGADGGASIYGRFSPQGHNEVLADAGAEELPETSPAYPVPPTPPTKVVETQQGKALLVYVPFPWMLVSEY